MLRPGPAVRRLVCVQRSQADALGSSLAFSIARRVCAEGRLGGLPHRSDDRRQHGLCQFVLAVIAHTTST